MTHPFRVGLSKDDNHWTLRGPQGRLLKTFPNKWQLDRFLDWLENQTGRNIDYVMEEED